MQERYSELIADKFNPVELKRMPGGICVDNFLLTKPGGAKTFLKILPEPQDFWKIKKEVYIHALLQRKGVPVAVVLNHGRISRENAKTVGFIEKTYIDGLDADQFLIQNPTDDNCQEILWGLGTVLASIHAIEQLRFGPAYPGEDLLQESTSWADCVKEMLRLVQERVAVISPSVRVGSLTAQELREARNQTVRIFNDPKTSLDGVTVPHLIHNDALLTNFIFATKGDTPRMAAVIDLEDSISGDPEFDLVQIENWLHFRPYAALVLKNKRFLVDSFFPSSGPSGQYESKRLIYHAYRSLDYLSTVFLMAQLEEISPSIVSNAMGHYKIIQMIASGKELPIRLI